MCIDTAWLSTLFSQRSSIISYQRGPCREVLYNPLPTRHTVLRYDCDWGGGKGWCRLPPDTFFVCLLTLTLQVRREPHSFRSETLILCQLTCTNQPISHTCLTESSQPLLKKCRETRKGAPRRGGGGRYVLKLNFKGEVMLLPLL